MKTVIILYSICLTAAMMTAQSTVINPSFEDIPSDATVPQGWSACAWLTTPDILPGYWGVYMEPYEGETYVGIITRDNGTYESFGQRLSAPLVANECYEFSIKLSHSKIYAGYGNPISLKISIADELCGESQVIYISPRIQHEGWQEYKIEFMPENNAQYIMLTAYYKDGSFSYKGNIMMDNMSSIVKCNRA